MAAMTAEIRYGVFTALYRSIKLLKLLYIISIYIEM
jgi:hypothetical protein